MVIDIRGIDIRGFEYSRHPFQYHIAAHEPNFTSKIKFADSLFAGLSSNTLTAKFEDQLYFKVHSGWSSKNEKKVKVNLIRKAVGYMLKVTLARNTLKKLILNNENQFYDLIARLYDTSKVNNKTIIYFFLFQDQFSSPISKYFKCPMIQIWATTRTRTEILIYLLWKKETFIHM